MANKSDVFEYSLVEFVLLIFFIVVVLILWYALFLNQKSHIVNAENIELKTQNKLLAGNVDSLSNHVQSMSAVIDSLLKIDEDSNKGLGKPPCDEDFTHFLFETNIVGRNSFKIIDMDITVNLDELLFLYGDTLKTANQNDCAYRIKAFHTKNLSASTYISAVEKLKRYFHVKMIK